MVAYEGCIYEAFVSQLRVVVSYDTVVSVEVAAPVCIQCYQTLTAILHGIGVCWNVLILIREESHPGMSRLLDLCVALGPSKET